MDQEVAALKSQSDLVGQWVGYPRPPRPTRRTWRKDAERSGEGVPRHADDGPELNIFHSNTQILCPAVYNSTPVPDVRRRYGDQDKAGKTAADIIERAVHTLDRYDFDQRVRLSVYDMVVPGRGVVRLRYGRADDQRGIDGSTCDLSRCRGIARFIRGGLHNGMTCRGSPSSAP